MCCATPVNNRAGEKIDKDSILYLSCDVLVPAAIGGVVDEQNAGRLRCKMLVEAANGPTTPAADKILRKNGIEVLPDIYTNGGKICHIDNLLPALTCVHHLFVPRLC